MNIGPRVVVVVASLLVCSQASAENSVYEESRELSQATVSDHGESSVEAPRHYAPLDITGNPRVSPLPFTNWRLGAEFLLYDVSYAGVNLQDAAGDDDLAGGLRIYLSWESDTGLGVRGRFSGASVEGTTNGLHGNYAVPEDLSTLEGFHFTSASPLDPRSRQTELLASTSTIDFFKHFKNGQFDSLFGIGLSGATLELNVPNEVIENSILGGGFSLFYEGKLLLSQSEISELALIGNGRVFFLEGEWEASDREGLLKMDSDLNITEAALGLEWKRDLGRSVLELRAQYEYQLWNSNVTSDLTLNGAALRAGLTW